MKNLRNPMIILLAVSLLSTLVYAEYDFVGRMTKKCGEDGVILTFGGGDPRGAGRDMCVKFENNGQCDITRQVVEKAGKGEVKEVTVKPGDSTIREFKGVFFIGADCQDDPKDEPCILDYQIIYSGK